jgi:hypothetical protein
MELSMLIDQTVKRYPNQDLAESMEGYLQDFEQVALRYSLPRFKEALAELRIKPGKGFFPRPDEVSAEIEAGAETRFRQHAAEQRKWEHMEEIESFWLWVAERMEEWGLSEREVLDGIKSVGGVAMREIALKARGA